MIYSMKETCKQTGLTYETLKYYCNQGLVPNVKRDCHDYRIFDEQDIAWIKSLQCLRQCGMHLSEMQEYVQLCLQGESSIPDRQKILQQKELLLKKQLEQIHKSLLYIEQKQQFYHDVLHGKIPYTSNVLPQK